MTDSNFRAFCACNSLSFARARPSSRSDGVPRGSVAPSAGAAWAACRRQSTRARASASF
eukprot:CAMPEP_0179091878 /NCGR_PEP_ID=MMETSP0796-20121207/41993_1 /TAXON_ID=73915 /ORGANISM="Pyrodinium bahamense, Strain pbaha01" /LENGTH=58 /DNA_ID=CAMNT_0020789475 /DNA_START=176 /DNA_END=349 /DNA_ORIENTATION=+